MRLTYHTDYGLRLLMLLAAEPERLHTIAEIARRHGVSRSHLMKVAMTLTKAGIVESLRGRSGGLRLARDPGSIGLGEVVRATEESFDVVECFDSDASTCRLTRACELKGVLHEAVAAFLAVLDRHTLGDLSGNGRLRRRLSQLVPVNAGRDDVTPRPG
jgi:Rrf2 family transcriptional regulator, nitric oxide-sensitive transcriptional repressor